MRQPADVTDLAAKAALQALQALRALADVPEGEAAFFVRRLQRASFPAGALLVRDGEPADRVHFIYRGLVRLFWRVDAREVNRGFDLEGRFTAAYDAFLSGEPSTFAIEAIEDTVTVWFDRATQEALYRRHACWERIGRRIGEEEARRHFAKEREIRTLSAEQRYDRLVRLKPALARRVPLYHLASFLGVAPETLSRIRARRVNCRGGS